MRRRPSSRLLVLDEHDQVLLFRFVYQDAALGSRDYWATPGGALEGDETFVDAAERELFEETGLAVETVGVPVAHKSFVLPLPDGERVAAEECYFLVRTAAHVPSRRHWTAAERAMMTDHRWWSVPELRATRDVVFPDDLIAILARVGVHGTE